MVPTFSILAFASLAAGGLSIVFAIGWDSLQAISWAVALFCSALFNAFAASVLHGFDRQVAATKELHSAIVASGKGEEPSLPAVDDTEVPTIPEAAKGPTKFTPATGKSAAKLRSDLGV